MVSGELENSLRGEVDDYINSRLSVLQDEITRLQSQVNEAFTRLLERSRDDSATDTSVLASISEHMRAAHERGIEEAAAESARTKSASDMAILKAGIDDLDDQRSQADILNTLVNRAASFAPRVCFFVVKNEQVIGWRARGLEGTVGDDAVREIVLPLSSETPLSDVVKTRASWSGQPGSNAEDYLLIGKLGSEPPQRMVAIPLIARGKAVAVLYADSAGLDADAISLEALETLVRVAGMAVELLSVGRTAPVPRPPRVEAPAPEQPRAVEAETAEPQPSQSFVAEEAQPSPGASETATAEPDEAYETETPTVEMSAPAFDEKGVAPYFTPPPPPPPVAHGGFEPQSASPQFAASPEAESQAGAGVQFGQPQPAEAPAGQYVAPLGTARRYGSSDAELPVDVGEDEKRLHNDARRFARLLVSEIKLYNEQKVTEGRIEGDLYERLREDIDRSRQMYDKRVAPPVAARYDYFHQELVNTLAEGDAGKLGRGYPGSTAAA
ncbi:MAG TPA: GAF domain-containing protein [Pyrinomonadaceae bacterium]